MGEPTTRGHGRCTASWSVDNNATESNWPTDYTIFLGDVDDITSHRLFLSVSSLFGPRSLWVDPRLVQTLEEHSYQKF